MRSDCVSCAPVSMRTSSTLSGIELDVLRGAEAARDAVDRNAADLGAAGDGELLAHHVGQRRELDDARGGICRR
jgi:hypothetical protein